MSSHASSNGRTRTARGVLALLASAVLCACFALPSSASAAAQLTLRDGGEDKVTYDLGEDRGKQVVSLIFDASEPLSSPPSVLLSDAKAGNRLFAGTLSAATELIGQDVVKVNVTVEPGDVLPDSYAAEVLLRGGGLTATNAPLVLDFERDPSECVAWILALLALGIGVFFGWLLKWLSTSAVKLRLLATRFELLMSSFDADQWTPPALRTALSEVRVWLALGEVESAEEGLKTIEGSAKEVLVAMRGLATLAATIAEGVDEVEAMRDLDASAEAKLKDVLATERKRLLELRDGLYPDPATGKSARETQAGAIAGFDMFLAEYADPKKRDGSWDEALTLYRQGDFAAAKAKWSTPPGAADALAPEGPTVVPEGAAPETSSPSLPTKVKWFAIRHAPALIGFLISLGIVVVGLETVFDVKTMFLANDVRDFLTLAAWGFGSALTGLTTAELASKVTPKLPGG